MVNVTNQVFDKHGNYQLYNAGIEPFDRMQTVIKEEMFFRTCRVRVGRLRSYKQLNTALNTYDTFEIFYLSKNIVINLLGIN